MMPPHCIGIDLDNTLGHYRNGTEGIFSILASNGISEKAARDCYKKVGDKGGYSPEKLLNEIAAVAPVLVPRPILCEQLYRFLQSSFVWYEDARAAFTLWQTQHIPICVVTAGDEKYQLRKVDLLGIHCDTVIVVPHVNEKAKVARFLQSYYRGFIVMIDDRESELDAIRDAGVTEKEAFLVHIRRSDSPYRTQVPKYRHYEINSLLELSFDALVAA